MVDFNGLLCPQDNGYVSGAYSNADHNVRAVG